MNCQYIETSNCKNCGVHTWQECGKKRGFLKEVPVESIENPYETIKKLVQQLIKERERNSGTIARLNRMERENYERVDFEDDRR